MEKKTDKPILTLALPFVQLDNDMVCDCANYDESGIFFVKDGAGIYHIVEVDLKKKTAFGNCLNANVCNMLTEQIVVDRMEDKLNPIHCRLEGLDTAICNATGDVVRKLDDLFDVSRETVKRVFNACEKVEQLEGVLSGIESTVRCTAEKKSSDIESVKGYVSEESLVEIIKNVWK